MKERDMFYQNVNQGYMNPMNNMPSGYNMNAQYQAYGPNMMQQMPYNTYKPNTIEQDDYEQRISKLERQVKNLDTRLQKLENINTSETDNFYMI